MGMFGWNFKLLKDWEIELAIEQCSRAPGGLFDKGDYTTQLYRNYNKPL